MIEGIILGGRLQFLESLANSGILHAGNPKAVKRFAASALMIGKPEYQLSFTTGICWLVFVGDLIIDFTTQSCLMHR